MPANAYPHLVFATDATTLPRTELESLVTELFADRDPAPTVEQGPLQAIVRLGDYALTFWYDDDSEGLPQRYADYAPTLKRRRISKCTTMIDFSGDADPDGVHADDARRITDALGARSGVYVFSEAAKSFVGMDEADAFAQALEPTTGPAEPVEPAPTQVEPAEAQPQTVETEPVEAQPQPVETEPVEAQPQPVTPATPVVLPEQTPEPKEEEAQGGFFKRLFGRRR